MKHLAPAFILVFLAACSEPEPPPPPAPKPAAKPAPTMSIKAPSGTYAIDPNHHSLDFSVVHLGLAPYVMRFAATDATLELDTSDITASKISVKVDPLSLRTNFAGDYKATHEGTPYSSFEEALSKDAKFLNAGEHGEITFESTSVEVTGMNELKVTGDLSMLAQTHAMIFDVQLTGSTAAHPWTKQGAIGLSASGKFQRSKYGIEAMLQPSIISDAVTVTFNGEFHQQASAEPAESAESDASEGVGDAEAAADEEPGEEAEPTEGDYEY